MELLVTGAFSGAKQHIRELEEKGHRVHFLQFEKDELPCPPDQIEGVICNGLFLFHAIEKFTRLRFIQLTSAGYDRVPMEYVKANGIQIYNARGVYSIPMAEFAVACVLEHYKKLAVFRDQQVRHEWRKHRDLMELAGKRVVIVGCGDVGTECAKRFRAFGCEVVGANRTVRNLAFFDRIVGLEALDGEITSADIVVVSIALCEDTEGLVKAKLLGTESLLVNISRGRTVDLTGARCQLVLDVFEEEPLSENSPLWDMENMIITPHNSFVGDGNSDRLFRLIISNLEKA